MPKDQPDGRHQDDATYDEAEAGYLPLNVEIHGKHQCTYKKMRTETKYLNYGLCGSYQKITMQRTCNCAKKLAMATEYHYDDSCHWKRIKDATTGQYYIYRRCYCSKRE